MSQRNKVWNILMTRHNWWILNSCYLDLSPSLLCVPGLEFCVSLIADVLLVGREFPESGCSSIIPSSSIIFVMLVQCLKLKRSLLNLLFMKLINSHDSEVLLHHIYHLINHSPKIRILYQGYVLTCNTNH